MYSTDFVPYLDFRPIPIPKTIMDFHNKVTLCCDHFWVQGIPFLTTISRNFKFRTVTHVKSRPKNSMVDNIKVVPPLYAARGFTATNVHAGNEFVCAPNGILPIRLNVAAADKHVGAIEQSIRTLKEGI